MDMLSLRQSFPSTSSGNSNLEENDIGAAVHPKEGVSYDPLTAAVTTASPDTSYVAVAGSLGHRLHRSDANSLAWQHRL